MKGDEREIRHEKWWRNECLMTFAFSKSGLSFLFKLICRGLAVCCISLEEKDLRYVEVYVVWLNRKQNVHSERRSDSEPELDSSDWEYFHTLILVSSVISSLLLNVCSSSVISARVGLREIFRVILLARDLSPFFLDNFWIESLMLKSCFIRLMSCVLISFWNLNNFRTF